MYFGVDDASLRNGFTVLKNTIATDLDFSDRPIKITPNTCIQ